MKIALIHTLARVLGVLVHIDGLPYGRRGNVGQL